MRSPAAARCWPSSTGFAPARSAAARKPRRNRKAPNPPLAERPRCAGCGWYDADAEIAAASAALSASPGVPDRADVKTASQRLRGVRAVVGSIDGIDRAPVLRELATALVGPDGVAIRYDSPWAEFLTGDRKP